MFEILIGTREQKEWEFKGYNTIRKTLHTGDYSVRFLDKDYDNEIAIERKELDDFVACCGSERDRFVKELERSMAIPHFFIIIEGSWKQIEAHFYRSQINPNSVIGSILSWQMKYGVHIILAENRGRAKRLSFKIFEAYIRNKTTKTKPKTGIVPEKDDSKNVSII